MLYKVTKNDIFKDNPDLEIIPEFASCTDRQLKYMMLVYDYESPLRQLPEEERKDKALRIAGYRKEKSGQWDKNARLARDNKTKSIANALHVFNAMQVNSDRALLQGVRDQIEEIVEFLSKKGKSAGDMEKAIKFVESLPKLRQTRQELEEMLNVEDEPLIEEETQSVRSLSTLDKINQEKQNSDGGI